MIDMNNKTLYTAAEIREFTSEPKDIRQTDDYIVTRYKDTYHLYKRADTRFSLIAVLSAEEINTLFKNYQPLCSVWDCENNESGFCDILQTETPMMEFVVTQCTENKNERYLGHLKRIEQNNRQTES